MRIIAKILFLAATIALASCAAESVPGNDSGEKGILSLSVAIDGTKSGMTADELLSNAIVNVYYADFSGQVAGFRYGQMPSPLYLPTGEYRVDVIAGEEAAENPRRVNWDQVSYKGSKVFTIQAGKTADVNIDATVHSAVMQVNFDGSVAANIKEGYKLQIGTDSQNMLSYGADENGRQSYAVVYDLDEPEIVWKFTGKKSKSGTEVVKEGEIKDVKPGRKYELNIKYTIREGYVDFDVYVDESMTVIEHAVVFDPSSTGLIPSSQFEIWAAHATVHADVDESEYGDTSKIQFLYTSNGSDWTAIDASRVKEGSYQAVLRKLTPATKYSYKLNINGEDIGDDLSFTTEAATPIPNGSFEETSESQSGNYTEFYNPKASDPMNRTPWWGSGNGSAGISGSADMGYTICMPDYSEHVDGNTSVKLQSKWAVVKFAAGNIFSGFFGGLVGTKGGRVYFGRPFAARPTGVRFWAKYSTGKINRIDDSCPYPVTTSDYDRARFLFALGNWPSVKYGGTKDSPVQFNTTVASTLIDFNQAEETVAYTEKVLKGDASDPYNQWTEYTLTFDYKKTNVMPQYFVISIAASMYGDYFTGYDNSTLWIDKMELIYE